MLLSADLIRCFIIFSFIHAAVRNRNLKGQTVPSAVYFNEFLISALFGGKWLASRFLCFAVRDIHRMRGWTPPERTIAPVQGPNTVLIESRT